MSYRFIAGSRQREGVDAAAALRAAAASAVGLAGHFARGIMVSYISTILVIDDNKADRALIAALLGAKYRVLEAPNAAYGLELYRSEQPHCVLLDHQMPGTAGLDALRSFTEENAVVVMLTGEGSDELAAEAFKHGARDYVLKGGLNRNMLDRIISRELERRRLELDLHAAQVELRLAQKLDAIGQLAAGVAHEINTPAQYVSDNLRFLADGFADLLPVLSLCKELLDDEHATPNARLARLRQLAAEADIGYFVDEAPPAIEQASEGITQIKKIVSAMKELSHSRDDMQATDLNHVIANMVTVSRSEWKYVADIALDLADDLPLISCFPSEINQVALNLLVNAAQAISDGRGEGKGRCDGMGEIRIGTRRDGGDVVLTVADTGGGIPEKIRDRIFDPFFTTKAIGKGTGQGLAITQRIVVDHHRGSIGVASEIGKGTCFSIRLPIEAAAPGCRRDDDAERRVV